MNRVCSEAQQVLSWLSEKSPHHDLDLSILSTDMWEVKRDPNIDVEILKLFGPHD